MNANNHNIKANWKKKIFLLLGNFHLYWQKTKFKSYKKVKGSQSIWRYRFSSAKKKGKNRLWGILKFILINCKVFPLFKAILFMISVSVFQLLNSIFSCEEYFLHALKIRREETEDLNYFISKLHYRPNIHDPEVIISRDKHFWHTRIRNI